MIRMSCSYDSSWFWLHAPKGTLAVNPAVGGGFQITRPNGCCHTIVEDGFENQAAAIEQAEWLLTNA